MADLQKTGVQLVAEGSAEFERTMQSARGQVSSFGTDAKKASLTWRDGMKAIGVAAAATMGAITAGVAAAGKVFQATVGELIDYNTEIRQLSSVTGQGVEASARLLEVFGDFNIEGSQVTTMLRTLAAQGLSPTIETIARLSDQYLAIEPGVARATFLQQNFGKSGADLAAVMEQGTRALLARNAAVETGLVPTEDQSRQIEELRQQIDDLNDSLRAVKMAASEAVVPPLLRYFEALAASMQEFSLWDPRRIIVFLGEFANLPINQAEYFAQAGRDIAGGWDEGTRALELFIITSGGFAPPDVGGARAAIQGFSRDEVQAAIDTRAHRLEIENLNRILDDLEGRHIRATVDIVANWDASLAFLMGEHGAPSLSVNMGAYAGPGPEASGAGVWSAAEANEASRLRYLAWIAAGSPGSAPGAARGADWMVGGRGGVDKNLVQFMATRGERVIVMPPQASPGASSYSDSHDQRTNNVSIQGQDLSNPFVVKRLFDQWLQGG